VRPPEVLEEDLERDVGERLDLQRDTWTQPHEPEGEA
jgi:hypothetical protein